MLTENQIHFLNEVCPNIWTEENGIISVEGSVNMEYMNLKEIPVRFGQVAGDFMCNNNQLTTLTGAPSILKGYFSCDRNQLTSLEDGPKEVSSGYSCSMNKLTSLIGSPDKCIGNFWCDQNQLTSLEGCPRVIEGHLFIENNTDLKYLWGIGRITLGIYYDNYNEINIWIIEYMRKKDIIFPFSTLEENMNWIKITRQYSILSNAPKKLLNCFNKYVLHVITQIY